MGKKKKKRKKKKRAKEQTVLVVEQETERAVSKFFADSLTFRSNFVFCFFSKTNLNFNVNPRVWKRFHWLHFVLQSYSCLVPVGAVRWTSEDAGWNRCACSRWFKTSHTHTQKKTIRKPSGLQHFACYYSVALERGASLPVRAKFEIRVCVGGANRPTRRTVFLFFKANWQASGCGKIYPFIGTSFRKSQSIFDIYIVCVCLFIRGMTCQGKNFEMIHVWLSLGLLPIFLFLFFFSKYHEICCVECH